MKNITDKAAIEAAKTLKKYCEVKDCNKCVFDLINGCAWTDPFPCDLDIPDLPEDKEEL